MAEDGAVDPAVAQLRAWASDKGLLALPSSKPALGDGDAEAASGGEGEQSQKAGKEQGETEPKAGKTTAKAGGKGQGKDRKQPKEKAQPKAEAAQPKAKHSILTVLGATPKRTEETTPTPTTTAPTTPMSADVPFTPGGSIPAPTTPSDTHGGCDFLATSGARPNAGEGDKDEDDAVAAPHEATRRTKVEAKAKWRAKAKAKWRAQAKARPDPQAGATPPKAKAQQKASPQAEVAGILPPDEMPGGVICGDCKNPVGPFRAQLRGKVNGSWRCNVCNCRIVQLGKRFGG